MNPKKNKKEFFMTDAFNNLPKEEKKKLLMDSIRNRRIETNFLMENKDGKIICVYDMLDLIPEEDERESVLNELADHFTNIFENKRNRIVVKNKDDVIKVIEKTKRKEKLTKEEEAILTILASNLQRQGIKINNIINDSFYDEFIHALTFSIYQEEIKRKETNISDQCSLSSLNDSYLRAILAILSNIPELNKGNSSIKKLNLLEIGKKAIELVESLLEKNKKEDPQGAILLLILLMGIQEILEKKPETYYIPSTEKLCNSLGLDFSCLKKVVMDE